MGKEKDKVNAPFKKACEKYLDPLHFQRMEVWTDRGVPDINLCHRGIEAWVECKWVDGGARAWQFSHPMTGPQLAFQKAREAAGGLAFTLARRGDTFKLWSSRDVVEVKERGWEASGCLVSLEGRPWDWPSLLQHLFRLPEGIS